MFAMVVGAAVALIYICASTSLANGHWSGQAWEGLARISKQSRASDVPLP